MVKIDWVEIPAGEFLMGLSEQQIADIRARVRMEAGVDRLVAISSGAPMPRNDPRRPAMRRGRHR